MDFHSIEVSKDTYMNILVTGDLFTLYAIAVLTRNQTS